MEKVLVVEDDKFFRDVFTSLLEEDGYIVDVAETGHEALKKLAKNAGGRWDPNAKVWRLAYGKVKGTPLEKHLLLDALDK